MIIGFILGAWVYSRGGPAFAKICLCVVVAVSVLDLVVKDKTGLYTIELIMFSLADKP